MPPDVVRRLIPVHAIVSWLDALLLLVVAILLLRKDWPEKPWFRPLTFTALIGTFFSFFSGLGLELHYRVYWRQRLFISSKTLGWLFERKMHLSFGVFAFALVAIITLLLARKDERFYQPFRAASFVTAAFALTICVISSIVAVARPFVD